jgi:hypothetical protein
MDIAALISIIFYALIPFFIKQDEQQNHIRNDGAAKRNSLSSQKINNILFPITPGDCAAFNFIGGIS